MSTTDAGSGSLLASLFAEDNFRPTSPRTLKETGLSSTLVETLILKLLAIIGSSSGRDIASRVCLPFGIVEEIYSSMRRRQLLVHTSSAQLGDYNYALTEEGRKRAQSAIEACAYAGPAPVPLVDYVMSVEAQSIRAESPKRDDLEEAFTGLSIEPDLFETLGPAVNSGAGLFLYGKPGNGKTTLAKRITACFGQDIWVPRTLVEDGQFIKFFDSAYHEPVEEETTSLLKADDFDQRWIKVSRPTVVAGGELTMDALEIRHDTTTNISEASLQLKSNCGCLLIDDFGRQRMEPQELLNRWIVPLESKVDFLTIATGKKIQVPFEQLIIFSTNLEPNDLTDDAFLRRIPYKIEVGDPTRQEFHLLFQVFAEQTFNCPYNADAVDYLIDTHYAPKKRPLRRCQPRDLLAQIQNFCAYNERPIEMTNEMFDRAVKSYFTVIAS